MAFEYLANVGSQVPQHMLAVQQEQDQYQRNADAARTMWRERKKQSILSKNRGAKGQLLVNDALKEADAAGLGDEIRSHILSQEQTFAAQQAAIAKARSEAALFGAPIETGVEIGAAPMPARPAIDYTNDAVDRQIKSAAEFVGDAQQPAGGAPQANGEAIDGTVHIRAEDSTNPAALARLNVPAPQVSAPRTYIEDALDYKPRDLTSGAGAPGATPSAGVFAADDPIFKWDAKDDQTAFRQYGKTLSSEAKATGLEPSEMLRTIANDAAAREIKPRPSQALLLKGAEGIAEYDKGMIEHALSQERARAAGMKAVADYRAGLVGKAKEYGAGSQAEEKFEADMGGRRAGRASGDIYRSRPVSETEKTQGELIANSLLDLRSAKDRGGFEGDYAAAMARAKADGNVNEDAIVGHLVAMGAWPSAKALALKNLMREAPGAIGGDIYKLVKQRLGEPGDADSTKRAAWYKDSEGNMRDAMRLKGYDIAPTPAEIAKMPPKEAQEAKRRAHQGKAKKQEKPARRKATMEDF